MEKIESKEIKELLVDILKYIDDLCKKNNIDYTLIGGTLIGAIRHKGFIPWDDDIDIALSHENYNKLIKVLKDDNNKKYKLINNEINANYYYPFSKVVDMRTTIKEKGISNIDEMGVYVDIFEYNKYPNNSLIRKIHFSRISFLKKLIYYFSMDSIPENILKKIISKVTKRIGIKRILKKYNNLCHKYNNSKSKFVVANWAGYGYKKEIQDISVLRKYKRVKFEKIEAQISDKYHQILTTTFGDYMKLPPENERVNHGYKAYWRSKNEE